jgi:hypothetical protein
MESESLESPEQLVGASDSYSISFL